MIPHLCSFYWGGGPLSYLQYLSIVSFKKHNPEWTINLFMPSVPIDNAPTWFTGEQSTPYTGKDFLAEAKKLCTVIEIDFDKHELTKQLHEVQRSDIIRWHILHEYGGVWSDIDILYVQPLDRLLDAGFDAAVVFHKDPYIGFLIAKPHQPLFNDLYTIAKDNVRRNMDDGYQSLGAGMIAYRYGSYGGIQAAYPQSDIVNLDMEVVYPFLPTSDIEEMFFGTMDKTTPDTLGLHWYNGSPVAKKYQNGLEKYRNNKSIISKLVKEYV